MLLGVEIRPFSLTLHVRLTTVQRYRTRSAGYITVTLMTFDKQSNGRRIKDES